MKTLIIVRHAHRETEGLATHDNGLSEKGLKQAKNIREFFVKRWGDEAKDRKHWLFLSSPKKRCQETLHPLVKKAHGEIVVNPLLDEGHRLEARVERFLEWWQEEAPEFTVICSHGDWIPAFFEAALGCRIDMKKAAWAEIECEHGTISLRWLVQELAS